MQQGVDKDGYSDNYYVSIDENGNTNVSHPYKAVSHKEQSAILGIIQSGIIKYSLLVAECDIANQKLKLEEYAESSAETSEEEKAVLAAKLSAKQELEVSEESSVLQPSRLGDEEVSTGADGDIDKTETVIATVRGSSNEGLTLIGEDTP